MKVKTSQTNKEMNMQMKGIYMRTDRLTVLCPLDQLSIQASQRLVRTAKSSPNVSALIRFDTAPLKLAHSAMILCSDGMVTVATSGLVPSSFARG